MQWRSQYGRRAVKKNIRDGGVSDLRWFDPGGVEWLKEKVYNDITILVSGTISDHEILRYFLVYFEHIITKKFAGE